MSDRDEVICGHPADRRAPRDQRADERVAGGGQPLGHRTINVDGPAPAQRVTSPPAEVRLAELVASLSLATGLGLGLPEEHVLRQTVIASRLARLAGVDEASTFYV